jgi:hypothetical protein
MRNCEGALSCLRPLNRPAPHLAAIEASNTHRQPPLLRSPEEQEITTWGRRVADKVHAQSGPTLIEFHFFYFCWPGSLLADSGQLRYLGGSGSLRSGGSLRRNTAQLRRLSYGEAPGSLHTHQPKSCTKKRGTEGARESEHPYFLIFRFASRQPALIQLSMIPLVASSLIPHPRRDIPTPAPPHRDWPPPNTMRPLATPAGLWTDNTA